MYKSIGVVFSVLMFLSVLFTPAMAGQKTISLQGKLTAPTSSYAPITGVHTLYFRLYDVPAGGNALWTEQHLVNLPANGVFNVVLGSSCTLDGISFNKQYYVGIVVDGGGATTHEMSPRQALNASSYSLGSIGDFNVGNNLVVANNISATGNLSVAGGFNLLPPGSIMAYAGTTAPEGWLLCNGAIVSRSAYPALFNAIGTSFGSGDGSTTFSLPNLTGKFIMGENPGQHALSGGDSVHSHEMPHSHNVSLSHTHGYSSNTSGGLGSRGKADGNAGSSTGMFSNYNHYHSFSGSTGGPSVGDVVSSNASVTATGTGSSLPPFVALNYIVKY